MRSGQAAFTRIICGFVINPFSASSFAPSLPLSRHVKMRLASCLPICPPPPLPILPTSLRSYFCVRPISLQYHFSNIIVVFLFLTLLPPFLLAENTGDLWSAIRVAKKDEPKSLYIKSRLFFFTQLPHFSQPFILFHLIPSFLLTTLAFVASISIPSHCTYTQFYLVISFITAQRLHCWSILPLQLTTAAFKSPCNLRSPCKM